MSDYLGRIITKNPQPPSPNAAPGVWTLDEAMQYSKAGKWPPGYQISRSVRLRSSAGGYFNRTPTTTSNRTTWTWSGWIKRGAFAADVQYVFALLQPTVINEGCRITADNTLDFYLGGVSVAQLITTQVFRDPSAWYHLVVAVDTTQATSSNRIKIYINGSQVTAFTTANYPTQNYATGWNTTYPQYIGYQQSGWYLDCYMTEINFIDGQALTPASFGYNDTATGVWQPLPYAGTYGTNGFYLTFADNSAATATTIGKDYSGNGNNWTPNSITVTSSTTYNTTYDSMVDVPINWGTDTGAGGEVRGNYAVMNPLDKYSNVTVSNGNLDSTFSAYTGFVRASFALPSTGKWYWEGTVPTTNVRAEFGIATLTQALGVDPQGASGCWFWYSNGTTSLKFNGSGTSWGTAWASGDIIGIAFDADAGTLTFYKNGSLQGGGAAFTGLTGTYAPMVGFGDSTSTAISINFGQRLFSKWNGSAYVANSAPSGYKALCTQNLPVPTILNGASYMAATTFTGVTGGGSVDNTVNGVGFKPDMVWMKTRSTANNHELADSVRGTAYALLPNLTNAEVSDTRVSAFNSNGFSYGTNSNSAVTDRTSVGWQWKGGGTGVSNTAGSVTSTVSANTAAGFSIATFTPPASGVFTFGHGLGVAPNMVIFKDRNTAGNWAVYHSSIGNTAAIFLNLTNAISTSSGYFNNTSPTSTIATGSVGGVCTGSSPTVAYSFAAIAGYSAFGSYTGNGSTDGPFVYCGFRPRFVMWKRSDSTGSWYIQDTSRNPYNQATLSLYPNLSDAETSGDDMDYLSNGFKIRDTFSYINASGGTFIYAAFAENPFTIARAR